MRIWTPALIGAALAAAPAAAQEGEITVAMHYTEEQVAPLLQCFEAYEEANPGTTVTFQQLSYRDYLQTVLTGRLAGQAPDIYHLYSIWGPQMVDNGVLAEPPRELVDFVEQTYAQGTVDAASINGQLWGVPTEVSLYMLVSNMELLREAGYDAPPETWEEFREVAQAVTTRNDQGRIETAGFAFADSGAGSVHPFYIMMYSKGRDIYEDGFGGTNLLTPEAAEALTQLQGLVEDGITDPSVDGFDFPAGGIGMILMANWFESTIEAGIGDMEQIEVSPIPTGTDWRTLQYAFFMGVDSQSDLQEQAWDLIAYVNGPDGAGEDGMSCMGEVLTGLGALTANSDDLAAMGEPSAFLAPYVAALEDDRAVTQPNVMQAAEIEERLAEAIDRTLA